MVAGAYGLMRYVALLVWLVFSGGIYRRRDFLFLCYIFGGGLVGGVKRHMFVCGWLWLVVLWFGGVAVGIADLVRRAEVLGWLFGGCPISQGGVAFSGELTVASRDGLPGACRRLLCVQWGGGGLFLQRFVCLAFSCGLLC